MSCIKITQSTVSLSPDKGSQVPGEFGITDRSTNHFWLPGSRQINKKGGDVASLLSHTIPSKFSFPVNGTFSGFLCQAAGATEELGLHNTKPTPEVSASTSQMKQWNYSPQLCYLMVTLQSDNIKCLRMVTRRNRQIWMV